MGLIRKLKGLNRLSRTAWLVLGLICVGVVGYVDIITSSPCLADTTNHEKEPEMAGLLDRVRPRHLAAWRSSFAWSGCGDSQPDN